MKLLEAESGVLSVKLDIQFFNNQPIIINIIIMKSYELTSQRFDILVETGGKGIIEASKELKRHQRNYRDKKVAILAFKMVLCGIKFIIYALHHQLVRELYSISPSSPPPPFSPCSKSFHFYTNEKTGEGLPYN